MKRFAVNTLGCKLNFSESSALIRDLKALDYEESISGKDIDLLVVNTCAVTQQAEKKCRQLIKQMLRRNPHAQVVVTGCFSQLSAEKIAAIEGVDLILGNEEKFSLIDFVTTEKKGKTEIIVSNRNDIQSFAPSYSSEGRTRCFLKIQDGCDYFCSYCAIPRARGKSRSANVAETVKVAEVALQSGVKELILTGVNIGTFGRGYGESLLALLQALDSIEGDFRIRIGSVEPDLLKDEIIEYVANSKRIAPHFHLPLQAGDNALLRLMKRRYTCELFAQRVSKIRALLPYAFIGVDVIVGMNGETDEMFEESYCFLKDLDVSQLHVFPYSQRPKTKALNYFPQNSVQMKKERARRLVALSEKKYHSFCEKNLGRYINVLFEEQQKDSAMLGYSDNYIRVKMTYNAEKVGRIVPLELRRDLFAV